MSKATRTGTKPPGLPVAESHDWIRVHGARENNLKDVSVEIPKPPDDQRASETASDRLLLLGKAADSFNLVALLLCAKLGNAEITRKQ